MQSVQNAAACLVSGTPQHDHITLLLHQLHMLPVLKRVDFKMASLVYRLLAGMAPVYLTSECQLMSEEGRHRLRSTDSRTCVVRRAYGNFGD